MTGYKDKGTTVIGTRWRRSGETACLECVVVGSTPVYCVVALIYTSPGAFQYK